MSTNSTGSADFGFGTPANYRIVVNGLLGEEWTDRLAGLSIASVQFETGPPRTTLEGRIHDQAELNGVIATLYGLHLPLVSVERLEDDNSDRKDGKTR